MLRGSPNVRDGNEYNNTGYCGVGEIAVCSYARWFDHDFKKSKNQLDFH